MPLRAGVLDGSWEFGVWGGSGAVSGMVGDRGVDVAGWQPVGGGVDGVCVADGLADTGCWLIVLL